MLGYWVLSFGRDITRSQNSRHYSYLILAYCLPLQLRSRSTAYPTTEKMVSRPGIPSKTHSIYPSKTRTFRQIQMTKSTIMRMCISITRTTTRPIFHTRIRKSRPIRADPLPGIYKTHKLRLQSWASNPLIPATIAVDTPMSIRSDLSPRQPFSIRPTIFPTTRTIQTRADLWEG